MFKSFTLENYHSPDTHYVKVSERDNPIITQEIERKAKFDGVDFDSAIQKMNEAEVVKIEEKTIMGRDRKEYGIVEFIYLYRLRNGKLKYGILKNRETVFFE